jgi:DNA helicase-2/ATP-dependent DNA helicase PcrA
VLARRGEIYQTSGQVGQPFRDYLGLYTNSGDPPVTLGDMTRAVRILVDRLIQDEVGLPAYAGPGPHQAARRAILDIFNRYTDYLRATSQLDFPALERTFLDRVRGGRLPDLIAHLGALLIDEYQDTNPLQERIYFELARQTGATLTVVGDDDQSLYRFRGATIELFRDFCARCTAALGGTAPRLLYLVENYRSTPEIVEFFNALVQNDADFGAARIQPPKPAIRANQPSRRVPVLGMFRNNVDNLATDLAALLEQIFRQGGRPADVRLTEPIRAASTGGDIGDAVVLGHMINEFRRPFMGNPARARLPWLLRQELEVRGIFCFNPRGRALKDIPEVARGLGLVLECLDPAAPSAPDGPIVSGLAVTNTARNVFRQWRQDAQAFLATDPPAAIRDGESLRQVVTRWRQFARDGQGAGTEWPLLDGCTI